MSRWFLLGGPILLIFAVAQSIAEPVKNNVAELSTSTNDRGDRGVVIQSAPATGKMDYETALRPAVLQKRSIANIARLLLGGNVPPNHPLVKYPDQKTWNLANNIMAALPAASSLSATMSGWGAPPPNAPSSALQNLQQLFETKAKIIPHTGQVVTGLTGLASVKGDLIRQIHSISTQAIAQAAAEAAARALASAAAAHAVTNSISNAVNPGGAQVGIKGGWSSSYQPLYADPPSSGKTPGEQPGPPYSSSSAYINHYQAPPSYRANDNPFAVPVTTPAPFQSSPALPSPLSGAFGQSQTAQPYQNGYYTLYNTQTPYTPAPPVPVGHARPTLSPNTLIATTSGYNPSLSLSSCRNRRRFRTNPKKSRAFLTPPVIVFSGKLRPSANNQPLTSFRRAVPAGIFGRHSAQHSASPSLLTSISSLLAASTAAYNAAFAPGGGPPSGQQPSSVLSNLLSSTLNSPLSHSPSGSQSSPFASYSTLPQGGSHYGGNPGSSGSGLFHNNAAAAVYGSATEARPSAVNPQRYPGNEHAPLNAGASYAQPGSNSYPPSGIQSSPLFGSNSGSLGGGPSYPGPNPGGNYPNVPNGGPSRGYSSGSGYPSYNVGGGSSHGHVGGWNTQHAGSPFSTQAWPSSPGPTNAGYSSGYAGATPGNFNYPPGSFGPGAAPTPTAAAAANNFPAAAGSSHSQQTYPSLPPHPYQSPAPNAYAPTQQFNSYSGNPQGYGGFRNPHLNTNYQQRVDQTQSASTMGNNDYDDDLINNDSSDNHSYQQPQQQQPYRRTQQSTRPTKNNNQNSYSNSHSNPGKYPSPAKKKPGNKKQYPGGTSSTMNVHDKRVIPTGNKKGSHISSKVDVVVDDLDYVGLGDNYNANSEYYDDQIKSEESRLSTKNRWRSPHSSGLRTGSVHHHDSHGGQRRTSHQPKQTPPENVRGNGGRPERVRPQTRRKPFFKNFRSKKTKPQHHRQHQGGKSRAPPKKWVEYQKHKQTKAPEHEKQRQHKHQHRPHHHQQRPEVAKTEAAHLYRGRITGKQQPGAEYQSRDIYTTLPEYVFRVGERPDVFLRPGKPRNEPRKTFWRGGSFIGRAGETNGRAGNSTSGPVHSSPEEEASDIPSKTKTRGSGSVFYEGAKHSRFEEQDSGSETESAESEPKRKQRPVTRPAPARSETEELDQFGEAVDEAARGDLDGADSSGIITSEEFDPEEREAFVDDVYADEQHLNRRNDQREEEEEDEEEFVDERSFNVDQVDNQEYLDDLIDRKKKRSPVQT